MAESTILRPWGDRNTTACVFATQALTPEESNVVSHNIRMASLWWYLENGLPSFEEIVHSIRKDTPKLADKIINIAF